MDKKLRTREAAEFLSARGEPISPRTLQDWRLKRSNRDGHSDGPLWYRDPVTRGVFYFESDLLGWIQNRSERLRLLEPARRVGETTSIAEPATP